MDLERLAREAGLPDMAPGGLMRWHGHREHLARFAALVLEEAAKVCEEERVEVTGETEDDAYNTATEHCAAAIRALKPAASPPRP
jgi:hypothetical protein